MIRDSRQPVEAHFHVVSDFRREIHDNSLVHPKPWHPSDDLIYHTAWEVAGARVHPGGRAICREMAGRHHAGGGDPLGDVSR